MNTKKLTAAIILFAAAGAAMAEAPYPAESTFVSTKTRAQVINELKQAQAQHLIAHGDEYPLLPQVHSSLTRAQVAAQAGTPNTQDKSIYAGA